MYFQAQLADSSPSLPLPFLCLSMFMSHVIYFPSLQHQVPHSTVPFSVPVGCTQNLLKRKKGHRSKPALKSLHPKKERIHRCFCNMQALGEGGSSVTRSEGKEVRMECRTLLSALREHGAWGMGRLAWLPGEGTLGTEGRWEGGRGC